MSVEFLPTVANSVGTTGTTSPEQIEVMELEGYSRPTYNKLVHSATTCSTIIVVIHKPTVKEFVDNTNTPTTCWGLGDSQSSQGWHFTWPTRIQKLNSLALAVQEICHGVQNYQTDPLTWTTPLLGRFFIGRVGTAMVSQCTKFEVSRFTRYEAMNGGAKCTNWDSLGQLEVTQGHR